MAHAIETLGTMKLGYNEQMFQSQITIIYYKMKPVITNPGHNEKNLVGPKPKNIAKLFVLTDFEFTCLTWLQVEVFRSCFVIGRKLDEEDAILFRRGCWINFATCQKKLKDENKTWSNLEIPFKLRLRFSCKFCFIN